MTRRVPVLPAITCAGCPCHGTVGRTPTCAANGHRLYDIVRQSLCIADELAWRNVAAGLAMVAFFRRDSLRMPWEKTIAPREPER